MEAMQREIGLLKNQLAHSKSEISKANTEAKQLKDTLTKTTATLNHTKTQISHDLRKRDTQIMRMKEHLADGGTVRRSKAYSSMSIRTSTSSSGPTITANYATYDPTLQTSLTKECDDQLLKLAQDASAENDQLAELLQATLASLDALVQIEEEEHPLFQSTAQSVIMLEAQLKVRLTALKNILEIPNYVPIEEVESRDMTIKELQSRLLQVEHEWSAAQNVLKGLTASVLQKVESAPIPKPEVTALGERRETLQNIVTHEESVLETLKDHAKTPVAISKENHRHPVSTIKLDSRLLRDTDELNMLTSESAEADSTPIRMKKVKAQRKNRRITIGLMAKEDEISAELQSVLDSPVHTSP